MTNGYTVSFGGNANVLKLSGDVYKTMNILKAVKLYTLNERII